MMKKLRRHPVTTYNNVILYGIEMLRIHQLPTDDLYEFKLCYQFGEDWFVTPVTHIERITQPWKRKISFKARGPGDIPGDFGEESVNCVLLINELNEVVGYENTAIQVQGGDNLKSFTFHTNVDHSHAVPVL